VRVGDPADRAGRSDGTVERLEALAECVLAGPARLGPVRLVVIDGPSGSGKSTFAQRLAVTLRARDVRMAVVNTDDLLAGWDDMFTFWPRLQKWILLPLSKGQPARYQPYDWHQGRFSTRWRDIGVPDVLVLEGVTSARADAEPLWTFSVYVTAPRPLRLARSIARDGERLRPQLTRWMAREDEYFPAERTWERVDVVVDGASRLPHDPEREYVRLPV